MMTNGRLELTDLITFLLYINNFTEPVKKLIDFTEQFQNGYTGYERFLEIMNVDPDIKDAPDAVKLSNVKGDITFEDVSFRYEEGLDKVLSHVDLKVHAGEYLCLVGSSGGGKTTLCSLIPRFYDVDEGRILIDRNRYPESPAEKSPGSGLVSSSRMYIFSRKMSWKISVTAGRMPPMRKSSRRQSGLMLTNLSWNCQTAMRLISGSGA